MSDDTERLVIACTDFATEHGIDAMLDVLAGIYQAYAPLSNDAIIKFVCDIAGLEAEFETVTVQ